MEKAMVIWLTLALLFTVFALLKPLGARIILGIFFIVMALGVNLVLLLSDPQSFVDLGASSIIPFYRWAFQYWLAANPAAFIIPIILLELLAGFLMLGKGGSARLGLLGAISFLLLTAPLNEVTLPNALLAVGVWFLTRKNLDSSLWDLLPRLRGSHRVPSSITSEQ